MEKIKPLEKGGEKFGEEVEMKTASAQVANAMMLEAIEEFPEDIRRTLIKIKNQERLDTNETSQFHKARTKFWKEKFGASFEHRKSESGASTKRAMKTLERLGTAKQEKIANLHRALKNLDEGEIVNEFADETRRIIYFDEDAGKYFVEEGGQTSYLDVADVLSDYAWRIKYVPDGEMIEPAYRRIAKRILVNEARRDLEVIYNQELRTQDGRAAPPKNILNIETSWKESGLRQYLGEIAEIMTREFLARYATLNKVGFVVERANAVEDGIYKYDLRLRSLVKIRGVGVGTSEDIKARAKTIGLQFTTAGHTSGKYFEMLQARKKYSADMPVDDVVFVKVRTTEFGQAFDRWISENKPSGGPEQFLSDKLKSKLFEVVSARLFDRTNENHILIFDLARQETEETTS